MCEIGNMYYLFKLICFQLVYYVVIDNKNRIGELSTWSPKFDLSNRAVCSEQVKTIRIMLLSSAI